MENRSCAVVINSAIGMGGDFPNGCGELLSAPDFRPCFTDELPVTPKKTHSVDAIILIK